MTTAQVQTSTTNTIRLVDLGKVVTATKINTKIDY